MQTNRFFGTGRLTSHVLDWGAPPHFSQTIREWRAWSVETHLRIEQDRMIFVRWTSCIFHTSSHFAHRKVKRNERFEIFMLCMCISLSDGTSINQLRLASSTSISHARYAASLSLLAGLSVGAQGRWWIFHALHIVDSHLRLCTSDLPICGTCTDAWWTAKAILCNYRWTCPARAVREMNSGSIRVINVWLIYLFNKIANLRCSVLIAAIN